MLTLGNTMNGDVHSATTQCTCIQKDNRLEQR